MSELKLRDGAYPILLTAFDENDELDLPAVGSMLDFYRGLGIPGVLALGQASEMLLLDHDERMRVAEYVSNHPTGDLAVTTVGNFGETLADQARSLGRIYEMGTDVAVVALALLPSPDALGEQLVELAKLVSSDVRLGIYEIPEPEHRLLNDAEVTLAAETGRYYFMKETSRQIETFSGKLRASQGSNLKIFQANLKTLPPSMEAGGHGFCGWLPIVAPELTAQVCDLSLPVELRREAQSKLMTFNDVMVAHGFPASAKHILALRGVAIQPYSRRPTADVFFEKGSAGLDEFISQENPFAAVALTEQA